MQATGVSNLGKLIMEARLAKGWTRADLADSYGRFFREESISEDTIRMWEEYNKAPRKPKRRYVLAHLLNISVAALGLEPLGNAVLSLGIEHLDGKKVDITAAKAKLQQYKKQNHATTVWDVLEDVGLIIHDIHDELPYSTGDKHKQLLLLLCDYQQFIAGVFRDHSRYDEALVYQNKAYIIAKTLGEAEISSLVLWRRGLTYHEQGDLAASISDFQTAYRLKPTSVQLQGAILSAMGHVKAHAAKDESDLNDGLDNLHEASTLLDSSVKERDKYFIKFNEEGYHLNMASAWLGAKNKSLISAKNAFEELAQIPTNTGRKRRYAYSTYLQAKGWFAEGNYPMATQLASDTLTVASEIKSQANINRIDGLYTDLKSTNYGNAKDVAALGVEIMRVQAPSLFH